MIPTRHFTVVQVARLLRCTPRAVQRQIGLGRLAAQRVEDGFRVPTLAIAALVDRAVHEAPDEVCEVRGQPRNPIDRAPRYVDLELLEDLMTADHLSLAEAADYIHRSTRTVRRWVEEGRLPNAKRVVQRLLIPREDLDALVQPARRAAVGA